MDYFNIDFFIVAIFLAITLIVGLWAGRGIKDIREYAIANKKLGIGVLTMTFLATYIGGNSITGLPAAIYFNGVVSAVTIGTFISFIIGVLLFTSKFISRFQHSMTLGDIMEILYGKYAKIGTGIIGLVFSIFIVGSQIWALGYIGSSFFKISSFHFICIAGIILVLYSSMGGIKSVAITDVLQFIALVVIISLITNKVTYDAGGIKAIFRKIALTNPEKLLFFSHPKFLQKIGSSLLWGLFCPIVLLYPPILQRILMLNNAKKVRYMFLTSFSFYAFFRIMIMLIGVGAFILYPTIQAKTVIPHLITNLFPPILQGILIAGLFAVIMSTADSFLNSAGILIVHDIIKPIYQKINEVKTIKIITFFIGLLAIIIAIFSLHTHQMLFYSRTILSIIMIPFIAGILGVKSNIQTLIMAIIGSVIGFFFAIIIFDVSVNFYKSKSKDAIVFLSLFFNGIAFVITSCIQNKGFVIINRNSSSIKETIWKPKISWNCFLSYFPTPKNILHYSHQKVKKYGSNPIAFGLFIAFNYMLPFFMHSYGNPSTYVWVLNVKIFGAILCIGLLLKSYWPLRFIPYFSTFYHFTILYCLSFTTTFLFFLEGSTIEWLLNVALAIMLLIVLTDWITFFILSFLGIFLAIISYKYVIGMPIITPDSDTLYTLIYTILFSTTIGLLFARRRQKTYDDLTFNHQQLQEKDQENTQELLSTFKEKIGIIKTLQQANIKKLPEIAKMIKSLRKEKQDEESMDKSLEKLEETLIPMAVTLERIESRALDYLQLDVKTINIQSILDQLQEKLKIQNIKIQAQVNTKSQSITCDPKYIDKLLNNAVKLLSQRSENNNIIQLILQDTMLTYAIPSVGKDYKKKIPAIGIVFTQEKNIITLSPSYSGIFQCKNAPLTEDIYTLLMHNNQKITKAHYGYTSLSSIHDATHIYILPLNLNEVRPKSMNDDQMQLGSSLERANDHYPGAQAQEKLLLKSIEEKSKVDLKKVKNALELIKYYHGSEKRKSGEPFYLHPIAVAQIVLDYNQEEETILAALLHDTVEDTAMLLESISLYFGDSVSNIVNGLTHLESKKDIFSKISLTKFENISTLLDVKDKRILYVKLADRLHNMRTLHVKSLESQQKKATETLNFFVPLAKYLKLEDAAQELKERSIAVLEKR